MQTPNLIIGDAGVLVSNIAAQYKEFTHEPSQQAFTTNQNSVRSKISKIEKQNK